MLSGAVRRLGKTRLSRRAIIAGAILLIVVLLCLHVPRPYPRILDGHSLLIPYGSDVAAYRKHATHVAPLPRRNHTSSSAAQVGDSTSLDQQSHTQGYTLLPQQSFDGLEARARRQEALEDDIDAYLTAHGIGRKRRTRVRFQIFSNVVDWKVCTALGSAALAGVSIPVTGFDASYSHVHRFEKYLDFIDREGLRDDDIVVTMDSDIVWTGADLLPFLRRFALYSPETEDDLDVAAVRAWEDYGERKAPLFMEELQGQATRAGRNSSRTQRPSMQMAPVVFNADDDCWWGQHSDGFMPCRLAFASMDYLVEVARNRVSSCDLHKLGAHVRKCGTTLRAQLAEVFAGDRRWMLNDMLRQPSASSPYTTKAPRDPSDPLFYHPSIVSKDNPTAMLNAGMHVARVWALRRMATMMRAFMESETPVPEQTWHGATEWMCDQGMFGEMYVRARLYEVEHNLLSGPPLSARTPRVPYDPRLGPPGLFGIDRRSEMVVLAETMERNPNLFHHSAYLRRQFPATGAWWVRNTTELLLGDNEPLEKLSGRLTRSRGGALVTPPLLWRSATAEDKRRDFANVAEDDLDTIHVPFIHNAAPGKHKRFTNQRSFYAWLIAARHDRRARRSISDVLRKEVVELWLNKERLYVHFSRMCEDPTLLSQPRGEEVPLWCSISSCDAPV